ncbi:MAG: hypothetical protein E6Q76_14430 [Rhizobium sp.]|nr:MAG: hypothetical protein E6Q76_14430 [Rhizobium sp.]
MATLERCELDRDLSLAMFVNDVSDPARLAIRKVKLRGANHYDVVEDYNDEHRFIARFKVRSDATFFHFILKNKKELTLLADELKRRETLGSKIDLPPSSKVVKLFG